MVRYHFSAGSCHNLALSPPFSEESLGKESVFILRLTKDRDTEGRLSNAGGKEKLQEITKVVSCF